MALELTTDLFTWNKATNSFTADHSDLYVAFKTRDFLLRDFILVSAKTGSKLAVTFSHTVRDDEGDILYNLYTCQGINGTFSVKIFND